MVHLGNLETFLDSYDWPYIWSFGPFTKAQQAVWGQPGLQKYDNSLLIGVGPCLYLLVEI